MSLSFRRMSFRCSPSSTSIRCSRCGTRMRVKQCPYREKDRQLEQGGQRQKLSTILRRTLMSKEHPSPAPDSSSDSITSQVMRRFIAAFQNRDAAAFVDLVAEDC